MCTEGEQGAHDLTPNKIRGRGIIYGRMKMHFFIKIPMQNHTPQGYQSALSVTIQTYHTINTINLNA